MFVRKKKNISGKVSVQVIDKSRGQYKVCKTIGSSSVSLEIERMYREGKDWIKRHVGQTNMLHIFEVEDNKRNEIEETQRVLDNVENILLNGTELLLDRVYRQIGFDQMDDDTLRQLVVARLCRPTSKKGTADYLKSHFDQDVHLSKIYRYTNLVYKLR